MKTLWALPSQRRLFGGIWVCAFSFLAPDGSTACIAFQRCECRETWPALQQKSESRSAVNSASHHFVLPLWASEDHDPLALLGKPLTLPAQRLGSTPRNRTFRTICHHYTFVNFILMFISLCNCTLPHWNIFSYTLKN